MFKLNAKVRVFKTIKMIPTPVFYEFNYVKNVEIHSSYKSLTDTATLTMPEKIIKGQDGMKQSKLANATDSIDLSGDKTIRKYLKLESFIEIYLGYNDEYRPAFRGYITEVTGDKTIQIQCQDVMYALKKIKAVKDDSKNDKSDLMNTVAQNRTINVENFNPKLFFEERLKKLKLPLKINAIDQDLGNIMINRNQSVAQVFEMLKEKGIHAYFKMEKFKPVLTITDNPQDHTAKEIGGFIDRNFIKDPLLGFVAKKLVNKGLDVLGAQLNSMNKAFSTDAFLGKARFRFGHNIIQDNLKVDKEAVKNTRIRVEKYFNNSNTPLVVELGDPDGPLFKTYVLHNDDPKEELPNDQKKFKQKVSKISSELLQYAAIRAMESRSNGLKGTITVFGEPFVRATDKVILENASDSEKNGTFQVESVIRTYGSGGYRQIIELGRKIEVN